jgi:hypothetical protein
MSQKKKNSKKQAGLQIGPSQATIIAAVIGSIGIIVAAAIAFFGVKAQIEGTARVAETKQAFELTQIALNPTPTSVDMPTSTYTVTVTTFFTPTETATLLPIAPLTIIQPVREDLDRVPIIYVGYQDLSTPGTQSYKVNISSKLTYLWTYQWCARYSGTLDDNLDLINFYFYINDVLLSETDFLIFKGTSTNGWLCQRWATMLSGWKNTKNPTLTVLYNIPLPITDGVTTYPIGEYRHEINLSYID